VLCISAEGFPPEGDDCDAVLLRKAYQAGWKRFAVYRLRGQRFHGVGLGAATDGVRIDLYGSNGDYTASGMDGLEMHIHGNAQDQVAQIAKRGKLVIYGDVGQTFMYGAKGRRGVHPWQRRRPAAHQRGGAAPGGHQRHVPGLPGRVVHGRGPSYRRWAS